MRADLQCMKKSSLWMKKVMINCVGQEWMMFLSLTLSRTCKGSCTWPRGRFLQWERASCMFGSNKKEAFTTG